MKDKNKAFEQWFEYYFENTRSKASPYSYNDVGTAFFAGWEKHKEKIQRVEKNGDKKC